MTQKSIIVRTYSSAHSGTTIRSARPIGQLDGAKGQERVQLQGRQQIVKYSYGLRRKRRSDVGHDYAGIQSSWGFNKRAVAGTRVS